MRRLSLPGSNGHNATTPNVAAINLTDDFEMFIRLSTVWATGSFRHIFSKDDGSTQRQYYEALSNLAGGPLAVRVVGGSGTAFDTQAHTLIDNIATWIRLEFDNDSGAGQYAATWSYSLDAISDYTAVSWTPIGTQTGASPGAIVAGTAALAVGSSPAGSNPLQAHIYRAVLLDGLAGSLVADFDACDFALGDTAGATALDSAGRTWTINGASSVITDDGIGYCAGEEPTGAQARRSPRYGLTRLARR